MSSTCFTTDPSLFCIQEAPSIICCFWRPLVLNCSNHLSTDKRIFSAVFKHLLCDFLLFFMLWFIYLLLIWLIYLLLLQTLKQTNHVSHPDSMGGGQRQIKRLDPCCSGLRAIRYAVTLKTLPLDPLCGPSDILAAPISFPILVY